MKSVIYIPGLGDDKLVHLQKRVIHRWNNKNIQTAFFEPHWHTPEPYAKKFARLLAFLAAQPHADVIAVGSSAGASLALSLFAGNQGRVEQARLVSGKFRNPQLIGPKYQQRAPALIEAVAASQTALHQLNEDEIINIHSYRPLFDEVIHVSEMKIPGAQNSLMPMIGHSPGIALGLLTIARPRE
jgi:predicted alpha/beta hydrolase family esterase